jgi:hypothetical protein
MCNAGRDLIGMVADIHQVGMGMFPDFLDAVQDKASVFHVQALARLIQYQQCRRFDHRPRD